MHTLPAYLRFLKFFVTVSFWTTVLFVGVMTFLFVKSTTLSPPPTFTISLPTILLTTVPVKTVQEQDRRITIEAASQAKISFYYPDSGKVRDRFVPFAKQLWLPTFLVFTILLFGLWQVKLIFDTLGRPDVFGTANVRRIRVIACLFVIYQILPNIIWLFLQDDITDLLDTHHVKYSIVHNIKFVDTFITAVLLFGLAEVFRSGLQLKQDQDLTI